MQLLNISIMILPLVRETRAFVLSESLILILSKISFFYARLNEVYDENCI